MNSRGPSLRIFWLCAIAVVGALVWITVYSLRLEDREARAQATTARQEATRLALWRMDSALTPVIAREASRPYFHYQSFYPTERAFTRMHEEIKPGDVLVPSPLLNAPIGLIRLYFQVDHAGGISSPQIPQHELRQMAQEKYVAPTNMVAAEDHLAQFASLLGAYKQASRSSGLQRLAVSSPSPGSPGDPRDAQTPAADSAIYPPAPSAVAAGPLPAVQPDTELNREFSQRQEHQALARAAVQSPENLVANRALELENARKSTSIRARVAAERPGADESLEPAKKLIASNTDQEKNAPADRRSGEAYRRTAPPPAASTTPQTDDSRQPAPASEALSISPKAPSREQAADQKDKQALKSESFDGAADPAIKELGNAITGQADAPIAGKIAQGIDPQAAPVATTDLTPSWTGTDKSPQLVFTRTVTVGGESFEQGFWLDWQLTRSWLLSYIGDLFPWADLQPVLENVRARPPEALGRTLASIPAELVIREQPQIAAAVWTPMRSVLGISWLTVLAALTVTWWVLMALQDLAERRGRFAAAVTHELRTPLTTFCLYSQMLADGMVPEERKGEYLGTMRSESGRLAGIVESVLEYARLGRHAPGRNVQRLDLHTLLAPLVEKLRENAATHGFDLQSDLGPAAGLIVRADPTGVERILTNLIDNACKYARGHAPEVIDLSVSTTRRHAIITIKDHGPGLTVDEARRVFEPYFRGPRTTDLGVPGLGLGLALAKGVAQGMGGDLSIPRQTEGAGGQFLLTLRLA